MAGAQAMTADAAERYAVAAFELARDAGAVDAVEKDLDALAALIAASSDLRRLVESPAFSREDKARALAAVAERSRWGELARRIIGVVALNGRAGGLPLVAKAYAKLAADHRGVAYAEVATAAPLSDAESGALAAVLKKLLGRDVAVRAEVRPEILGGLVVKVGSRMFDSSLKSKLEGLKAAMKGG